MTVWNYDMMLGYEAFISCYELGSKFTWQKPDSSSETLSEVELEPEDLGLILGSSSYYRCHYVQNMLLFLIYFLFNNGKDSCFYFRLLQWNLNKMLREDFIKF